ncbi:protein-glutamine gamma-glutamyltransferase K-like isoform X2 [Acanthaster planci]|uniref:protein-glutamine gamma-glutamyltransferase n=1 Tax=Acanthaster planci TaxID=133434 RepID=A0A8B7ZID4_ACAPL|nr:protein-glutamine gamma-glutamyltransferase K-like isoform X2 [Acanthaster planci]
MGTASSRRAAGSTGPSSDVVWIGPRNYVTRMEPRRYHFFDGDEARRPSRINPALEERRTPTPPPTDAQLKVENCNLQPASNKFLHYTAELDEVDWLVVRRGQPFQLDLTLNRPYDKSTDDIKFDFQTGSTKNFQKGTQVLVSIRDPRPSLAGGWKAEIKEEKENTLTVSVTASASALVGKYHLTVRTTVKSEDSNQPQNHSFKEHRPICLLFNAWCEEDQVYLDKEEERKEYVLNERGYIWYGNSRQLGKRPWGFDQFEKGVFDAVMYLLETHVDQYERGSSVLVSRSMSAAVNSQDDNGVLSGRWDGNYKPHASPSSWSGSQHILEEHFKTKSPVRYGQCWVFSGVLTTVLRCLGIPARSVTNFASAHDTDNSLTIDRYYDENGERMKQYESDSIWNFHVWNEAWMSRPDVPPGYGGWQAVDATPQETSGDIYRAGPCSVSSIKQGQVYYPYDARFVFAEVNGDIVNWQVKNDHEFEVMSIKKSSVGKNISTKAVGSRDRQDLTREYKHPEGSAAERAAVKTAVSFGTSPWVYDHPENTEDVHAELELPDLWVGADFEVKVPLTNRSQENRSVSITVIVQVVYYTGVLAAKIKKMDKKFQLGPGQSDQITMSVNADEYLDKMVDQSAFKIFLLGHVDETGQAFVEEEDFRLRTPDLDVKLLRPAANDVRVGEPVEVELNLSNPLKKNLTNCEVTVEGAGLLPPRVMKQKDVVGSGTLTLKVDFKPRKAGERTLVATFDSDQLSQVTGELDLNVLKAE